MRTQQVDMQPNRKEGKTWSQTDRQADMQSNRKVGRHAVKPKGRQTCSQTERQADMQSNWKAGNQAVKPKGRQTRAVKPKGRQNIASLTTKQADWCSASRPLTGRQTARLTESTTVGFLETRCAISSAWPGVDLRCCPWLLLFQYWTDGLDTRSSLCPISWCIPCDGQWQWVSGVFHPTK